MSRWWTCPTQTLESWIWWWLVPSTWHSPAMWSCSHRLARQWTCSSTMAPVATHSLRRCTAMRADTKGPRREHHLALVRLVASPRLNVGIGWFLPLAYGDALAGTPRG